MPNYDPTLDDVFQALAHPVRRTVVRRLTRGPASVSELAESSDMALPSFLQHLDRLAACGLVESEKEGRVRTFRLTPEPLERAEGWMSEQRNLWKARLDQLDDYLQTLKHESQSS